MLQAFAVVLALAALTFTVALPFLAGLLPDRWYRWGADRA